jgi:WD40 repeat protein
MLGVRPVSRRSHLSDNRRSRVAPFPSWHGDAVRALAFSSDHGMLATGCQSGVVRVWSVRTGSLVWAFDAGGGYVTHIAWVEREIWVSDGWRTRRYRVHRPGCVGRVAHGGGHVVDARGSWLLIQEASETDRLLWWNVETERVERALDLGERLPTTSCRLGPGGTLLIPAGGEILTVDPLTGTEIDRIPAPPVARSGTPEHLAVADDGTMAFCGSMGNAWIRPPGEEWRVVPLPEPSGVQVYRLEVSSDGALLAVSRTDRVVTLVDLAAQSVPRTLPRAAAGAGVLFDPRGRRLHAAYDGVGVMTWDLRDRRLVASHRMPRASSSGRFLGVGATDDGLVAVTFSKRNEERWVPAPLSFTVWDVSTDCPLATIDVGPRPLLCLDATVVWPWVVFSGKEGNKGHPFVRAWDGRTGRCAFALDGVAGQRFIVLATPDGHLAVSDLRGRPGFDLVDLAIGTSTRHRAVRGWRPVAFSPDRKRVALDGGGWTARVVTLGARASVPTRLRDDSVEACAWSPDGSHLACVHTYGRKVSLWHEGEYVANGLEGHRGPATCLAFSTDGRRLATTGTDGQLIVWSVATGRRLMTLPGFEDTGAHAPEPDADFPGTS